MLVGLTEHCSATTHSDLVLRARAANIAVNVVHNASIVNAVGCTGLQLYAFGETVSVVFWTDTWRPDSYVDRLNANRRRGLHTLCLLDIKVKEQTDANLMRKGAPVFEPPRYMTAAQAAQQLCEVHARRSASGEGELGWLLRMCLIAAQNTRRRRSAWPWRGSAGPTSASAPARWRRWPTWTWVRRCTR